jgi:hypothetical protein
MINGEHKSMIREGIIDHKKIEYQATVYIDEGVVVSAEGEIVKPKEMHPFIVFGTDFTLLDKQTEKKYEIIMEKTKFIYKKFDDLEYLF